MTIAPPCVAGRAARPHRAEAVLDAERGAEHVDLEHPADALRVEVDQQAGDLDARVVDQDVETAQVRDGLRHRLRPAVVGR